MAAIRKSKRRPTRDTYFDLVRAYPLRAIRTESEAIAAGDVLVELLMNKADGARDAGERHYIDALSDLILRYQEGPGRRFRLPRSKPVEILKHLMAETDMTVSDLGKVIGSQPAASMILADPPRRRSMSKSHILKLARHFKVSPSLFLDPDDE